MEYEINEWIVITLAELLDITLKSKDYSPSRIECPICRDITSIRETKEMYEKMIILLCGCHIKNTSKTRYIKVFLESKRFCYTCGRELNFVEFVNANIDSYLDLQWIWDTKNISTRGKVIPLEINCCDHATVRTVRIIECKCGETEEMQLDEQRIHSQNFEWEENEKDQAIYRCFMCKSLVKSKFNTYEVNE